MPVFYFTGFYLISNINQYSPVNLIHLNVPIILRILFYLDTHSGFIRTLFRSAIFSKIGIIFLLFCDHLSHGFTHHFDAVSTINQPIHYRIGNCWVTNYVKPLF